jgi:hypothetical protein
VFPDLRKNILPENSRISRQGNQPPSRFQATLEASEFEIKFILTYWGLIGFDFGFIDLSNVFIDRLRVPKYFFKAPNKRTAFTHNFFIDPKK